MFSKKELLKIKIYKNFNEKFVPWIANNDIILAIKKIKVLEFVKT